MSSTVRSSYYHGRHGAFRQRKFAVHRSLLLAGALLVLAFCGAFLLLRFVLRDSRETGLDLKNAFISEKMPQAAHLASDLCSDVCYTKDCITTAAITLGMMDPTVDPCEDFYSYACAGFKKIPTEYAKRQLFLKEVDDHITNLLQDMIKRIPKSLPENIPGYSLAKLRNFYDSCVDIQTSDATAVETAFRYLERFGVRNWPNLDHDYNFRNPDIYEVLINLYQYDQHPLFYLDFSRTASVGRESEDHVEEIITMQFMYYHNMFHYIGKVGEETMKILKAVLTYLIPNDTVASEMLEDVIEFDMGLFNITKKANQRHESCSKNGTDICLDYVYNCAQGGDKQEDRWCKIASEIMQGSGFPKTNISIRLQDGGHFREISEYLQSANQKTVADALALYIIKGHILHMNFGLRKETTYPGYRDVPPQYYHEILENRSPFCAAWASYRLPILAGFAYYSQKYNNSDLRKVVNQMYSDLKEITLSTVKDIPWIDTEAKVLLEELFANITFAAETYVEYISNATAVDEFYKQIQITDDSFLANELEARKIPVILHIRYMDNQHKWEELVRYPFAFNPSYNFRTLTVSFDIGSFVFPLMSADRPRYANLGYLGFIMGHEFAHSTELFLRNYENKTEDFENKLQERRNCMEEYFSEFDIEIIGEKVKGNLTYPENIADYFGIRAAYKSMKKHQENHGIEQTLPGLHFTNEQSFFIIAAQCWCETNTVESLKDYLKDVHSPANIRILGTYKHFDAFSQAFNCPVGSPMNPAEKCSFE